MSRLKVMGEGNKGNQNIIKVKVASECNMTNKLLEVQPRRTRRKVYINPMTRVLQNHLLTTTI
jgi:hypothetical protein